MLLPCFTVLLFCFQLVNSETCDLDDIDCATKVASAVYAQMLGTVSPRDNLEKNTDPLFKDIIVANLPTVKYTLRNATFSGFKSCSVAKVDVCKAASTFDYYLQCPDLTLNADHYKMEGTVDSVYVKGQGSCTIEFRNYVFIISGYYENRIGDDNAEHFYITEYKVDAEAKGKINFNFRNLFCGDYEKANAVLEYFNKNWKQVDKILRGPAITSFMDLLVQNLNSYFDATPADTMLSV